MYTLAMRSVLVLFVLNSMYRLGLVDTLVTHANMKEFGLASLSGASSVKNKQKSVFTLYDGW